MGFFFNKPSGAFYSAVLGSKSCKFYFREIGSGKNILSEDRRIIIHENGDDIAEFFAKFSQKSTKKTAFSTMVCGVDQGAILASTMQEQSDEYIYEIVDENFKIYYQKSELERLNSKFNTTFNLCFGAFKVLYFLLKNQPFTGKTLFVLKLEEAVALIVTDESRVCYTKMVDIAGVMGQIPRNPNLDDVMIDDMGEVFYALLQEEIRAFYALENGDFLEQIFIYDDDTLGAELGYLIYTRLHIKTELIPIDLADYINKMSIKELA